MVYWNLKTIARKKRKRKITNHNSFNSNVNSDSSRKKAQQNYNFEGRYKSNKLASFRTLTSPVTFIFPCINACNESNLPVATLVKSASSMVTTTSEEPGPGPTTTEGGVWLKSKKNSPVEKANQKMENFITLIYIYVLK